MKPELLILTSLVLAACATPEETLVGKPPEQESVVEQTAAAPSAKAPARPRFPPARLTINTWPYVEPGTTFSLTWNGGNQRAPLHEAPNPNSRLLGDVVWDNGERILWRDTFVASYRPRILRATDEWFVEGPVYEDGFLVDQEFVQLEVKKGDRVEVWAYGGDRQCYMARRSKIITGPCPPADRFSGLGQGQVAAELYMPDQKVWWIQITGNNISGWVAVDDRMVVDIEVE